MANESGGHVRRDRRVKYIKGRQEGGMYGDVDGWIVHGSAKKVERNKRKRRKRSLSTYV